MKTLTRNFPAFLIICIVSFSFSTQSYCQEKNAGWYLSNAPFPMPQILKPNFPAKQFLLTDFGATGDGQTLNTNAFAKAINACSAAGGGRVVVPAGLWLTGPIEMKSNVNLVVERGALIQFTKDHSQYPIIKASIKSNNYVTASPIYGYGLENIAITGGGIIDGAGETWRPVKKEKVTAAQWKEFTSSGGVINANGTLWWPTRQAMEGEQFLKELKKKNEKTTAEDYLPARDYLRPYMVYFIDCKNILIENVTLRNSPKFVFYPNSCTNVTMDGVNIFNEWWAQNGDGIDISRCRNVLIYDCNVSAGDDGICMKSSGNSKDDGQAALKNIIIAKCVVYHGHGGFVIGSNTDGGMENISVSDCDFIGTDIGIRMKSNEGRGGLVKNIFIKNIFMTGIVRDAISFNTYYEDVPAGKSGSKDTKAGNEKIPHFTDFYFDSIYCNGAANAISITGLPSVPVKNISFKNMVISSRKGFQSNSAADISLDNVKIISEQQPLFQFNSSRNITIKNSGIRNDVKNYYKADEQSSGINISKD